MKLENNITTAVTKKGKTPPTMENPTSNESTTDRPLFVSRTGEDAIRPDLEFKERQAVVVLVKHWSDDTYLILEGREAGRVKQQVTFVTGGIEEGQTAQQAAKAEIQEETGFNDLELVEELLPYDTEFFHTAKNVNRRAHFQTFLYKLKSDSKVEVSEKEKNLHDIGWVKIKEAIALLSVEGNRWLARQV